jgi:uncharacterized protein YktB (UPF0637 family)
MEKVVLSMIENNQKQNNISRLVEKNKTAVQRDIALL